MDEGLLLSFLELEVSHWWFVVRRKMVLEELHRHVSEASRDLLEVGCGAGGLLSQLALLHPGWSVKGVEPSHAACSQAIERGCDVACATFEQLPSEDESVDVLVALDVLEHCEGESAALGEAARTLRPGGVLLVTVPALPSLWSPHDELNGHYRRYTRTMLTSALVEADLSPVRVTYFNSLLLPAAWALRKIAKWLRLKQTPGLRVPWGPLNSLLSAIFSLEVWWLRMRNLPPGLSLMAVAARRR